MELKKVLIALIATFYIATTNAQSMGIGGSFNHTSNGINLFYVLYSKKDKWNFEPGIRVMVNTYSINGNKNNYVYYQNGYANTLFEHFSLNFRLRRKLTTYKFIGLEAMSNLHLTYHSLFSKNKARIVGGVPGNPARILEIDDVRSTEAGPGVELTIGLMLRLAISKKVQIYAGSGFGFMYMHYSNESYSRALNAKVTNYVSFGKNRGQHDYVGLDGLPMMTAGLIYRLPKNRKKHLLKCAKDE